jgi:cytochrome c
LARRPLDLFLLALVSIASCSSPPAPPPPLPESKEPAPAAATVDLHGDWERWIETPRQRERALSELSALPRFGFGREASAEEVAAIDIDVMPDGTGLPEGKGTVARGRDLYRNQCVQCHGTEGQGADYEALAGREPEDGFPFSDSLSHRMTVGNYWPYATTLYDYIHRAMPQAVPGSLPPDDVYSLVAYVLYLNRIVPEDATLDKETLPEIEMPARDRFVYDDRRGGEELR